MATLIKQSWFNEHRGWEDTISAAVGVLILLSPIISNTGPAVAMSAGFAGMLIAMLALLELMSLRRWEEIMELICGTWVFVSPFVFQYGGALRTTHVVLGSVVVALAVLELWQDRNRRFDS
jgi:hypothetical protein